MKRFFVVILILCYTLVFSQQSPNRFDDQSRSTFENTAERNDTPKNDPSETGKGPGNPGEPVPVDDYIPLLLLTAIGLIILKSSKRKKLL